MKLQELPLKDQKVLIRVDFNVPLDDQGNITDDSRIRAALPTIEYVLQRGGRPILMSHLGRPTGKPDSTYSLYPCAKRLEEILHKRVIMAPDCVGSAVEKMASELAEGEILLLENLRFHAAEKKPETDPEFAKKLAGLGDVFINDAFGTAHRAHSSITEVVPYFKGLVAPGFLLEKEIQFLGHSLENPEHPFYAIIGGAKISTKLGALKALLHRVDALFIGGGMAYTFLKANGVAIGDSICEENLVSTAKEILSSSPIPLFLPKDLVIADAFDKEANSKVVSIEEGIPAGWQGMDIGPLTRREWKNTLTNAKMVFWNGPLGVFEMPKFSHGTVQIAEELAQSKAKTIIGGGDSAAAIYQAHLEKEITHISTGGGASLEYIEKGMLPGIEVLIKN